MDASKESILAKLLQPPSSSRARPKSLIQDLDPSPEEIDEEKPVPVVPVVNKINDEPTMFEMMMEAQREAACEKKQAEFVVKKAEETTFAKGFKKGFFGNANPVKVPTPKSTKASGALSKKEKTDFDDDIIDLTGVSGKKNDGKKVNLDMNSSKSTDKKDDNKFVFEEVQKALDEDQHPLLQQINKNGLCPTYFYFYTFSHCLPKFVQNG
jgi:hypothetical protein